MKNKRGFTLIEVILSIAILGMIAIFVVTIFGSSLKNISGSGKRTEKVFELESKINEEMLNKDGEEEMLNEDGEDITIEDVTIKVNIPGVREKGVEVEGKMITAIPSDSSKNQYNIKITTFVPNKPDETQE